jgi:bacterioferritin-associated ferredoxin
MRLINSKGIAMIVCVCNNVSDHKIRQAVDEGMVSLAELRTHLQVGTCCGKCNACAKDVIRDHLASQPVPMFRQMPIAA